MRRITLGLILASVAFFVLGTEDARAQALGPSFAQKPFANYQAPPTVSPYLNLNRLDDGGVDNYSTLVVPQIQRQQAAERQQLFNQRLSRAAQAQQRQIQGIDQLLRSPNAQTQLRTTGLEGRFSAFERFQNFSHFYGRGR